MTARGGSPAVSVVIPAYNSERTLRACLESVYAQDMPADEVLVIDDGSTDRTAEIARGFPCTLIASPANRGPAAARNLGIARSRGEILFFVDSDGALAPTAIGNAVRIMSDDPDVACVHGIYSTRPLVDDGPIEAYRLLHGHFWRARSAGRVPSAYFAMCAIRRAVFDDVGVFDENLRASEDDELSDRMRGRYAIVLTTAVSGRHDDDSRLWAMLRKQYRRSQLLIPVARAERGPAGLRANRPAGLAAAGLAVAALPLAALGLTARAGLLGSLGAVGAGIRDVWVPLAALPLVFLVGFALADPGLCRFVWRERGPVFLPFFLGAHFLVQLAIIAGALSGGLRGLTDPGFGPARRPGAHLAP
jgi:hypothetical protein